MTRRLLVLDDNPRLTKIVAHTAAPLGFTTRACHDPLQAMDAFIEFRPDVVMVDMCMPEKDGIEVLHEILLTEIPVKVVLTSGYGNGLLRVAQDVAAFHAHPDVACIRKPFRTAELADVLTAFAH